MRTPLIITRMLHRIISDGFDRTTEYDDQNLAIHDDALSLASALDFIGEA